MFYEERSLGLRSWSGKTLGNNSCINKSKQRQVCYNIYLGNRGMEREIERGCEQNTFTHLFIPAA